MATSHILLISDYGDTVVADALNTGDRHTTSVGGVSAALIAIGGSEFEVIVVDLAGPALGAVEACREIREAEAFAGIPILCVGASDEVEDRIRLLEAGVDDVIARPFDARELDARAEALVLRYQRSRNLGAADTSAVITNRDGSQQRVIAFYSPKGGVGTTTVAVNVAVALATRVPNRVAIIDLDLQFGQVATHLNIAPRLSLADLAHDDVALRDPAGLAPYLERHASSLAVFAAPSTPDNGQAVTEAVVRQLLETAARAFQYVVVDAGSELDARTEAVLARASDVVIVVTPEFPALKAVHALRELISSSGTHVGETSYVLNQIFAREILRLRDIEEALETKIAATIPYDGFAFLKAVNEGVPVVTGAPKTASGEQLLRLTARLAGLEASAAPAERRSKGLGSLFSRG